MAFSCLMKYYHLDVHLFTAPRGVTYPWVHGGLEGSLHHAGSRWPHCRPALKHSQYTAGNQADINR